MTNEVFRKAMHLQCTHEEKSLPSARPRKQLNENRKADKAWCCLWIQVKIDLWTVSAPDLPLAKASHSHHLVQTFQANFPRSATQITVCVSEGGNSLALHPARAKQCQMNGWRTSNIPPRKYSPPKNQNSSEMFKYSVKIRVFEIQSCTLLIQ